MNDTATSSSETILIVETQVLERSALAEYLRHCGYRVLEAASGKEAIALLSEPSVTVDIVFSVVEKGDSADGFALAQWVRTNRPRTDMVLSSDMMKASAKAGELCESGPHGQKPYEPSVLVDWIKRLRASKAG